MKRKVLVGTLAAAIVLGGAFAEGSLNNGSVTTPLRRQGNKNGNEMITIEEAEKLP